MLNALVAGVGPTRWDVTALPKDLESMGWKLPIYIMDQRLVVASHSDGRL